MRNEMNRTSSQSKTSEYQRTRPRREKTGCRVRASSHGSPEPDLGRALALLTLTCARPPGPQPQACQAQLWGPPCPSPAVAAEARAWTPQPAGQGPAGVAAPRDPAASFDSGSIALPDPSSPFPEALGRGTLNRCLLSSQERPPLVLRGARAWGQRPLGWPRSLRSAPSWAGRAAALPRGAEWKGSARGARVVPPVPTEAPQDTGTRLRGRPQVPHLPREGLGLPVFRPGPRGGVDRLCFLHTNLTFLKEKVPSFGFVN